MKIWVLAIFNEHGIVTSLHRSEDEAIDKLYEYVKDNWGQRPHRKNKLAAIDEYFVERWEQDAEECYQIDELEVPQ